MASNQGGALLHAHCVHGAVSGPVKEILGLDLSSNGLFMRALEDSELLNYPVSSDPFKLVEGDLAYIIHRPVPASVQRVQPYSSKTGADVQFAALVIRADTLLDRETPSITRYARTVIQGNIQRNGSSGALTSTRSTGEKLVGIESISTFTCKHDAGLCKSTLCFTC